MYRQSILRDVTPLGGGSLDTTGYKSQLQGSEKIVPEYSEDESKSGGNQSGNQSVILVGNTTELKSQVDEDEQESEQGWTHGEIRTKLYHAFLLFCDM